MNRMESACCDDRLRLLLQAEDDSHEYRLAMQHVDECARCQARLEQLAADRQVWQEAQAVLTAEGCDQRVASDVESPWRPSRWSRRPTAWTESMARQLLAPPSHPEMLGRIGRYEVERLIGAGGMEIPPSAIPGQNWVDGGTLIIAISDDGKTAFGYSEPHPRWAAQNLEPLPNAKAIPVVGHGIAAVMHGNFCHAYSPSLGRWDSLKLPVGETAVPAVGDDSVSVHSASQGDYAFKNAWGKWFSADEIKAGKVAEFLQTRQATVPAARRVVNPELEIRVFSLVNMDATEVARLLRQLYGEAINPVVDVRTNSLVCKNAPSALDEVEALLLKLESTAIKGHDLPTSAQPVDGLRKLYNELERRSQELAAKLRYPAQTAATAKQWNGELRETVQKAFEARQNLQRAELADFTQRLQGIQQSIEMRDRISQQIIDRRMEELLDPNLKWDAPAIVSENQVPPVRDDDHVTYGNLPKSTPPADQSSNRYPGGKPLKAFVRIAFDKRQLGKIDWLAGPEA